MNSFREHLILEGFSPRTVESYVHAISQLNTRIVKINDNVLLDHKEWLIGHFSARTANARIAAINTYLDHIGYQGIRLKSFKIQQRPFLETSSEEPTTKDSGTEPSEMECCSGISR